MSILDYQPITEIVETANASFAIRGLSSADLRLIVETNLESFDAVVSIIDSVLSKGAQSTLDAKLLQGSVVSLAQAVPSLLPQIIALATDGGDFQDRLMAAARMPAPLQVDITMKIGGLTFQEVGGVKKFLGEFVAMKDQLKPPQISSPKSDKAKSSKSTKASVAM